MDYQTPQLSAAQISRITSLKQDVLSTPQSVCVERLRYVTEAYQKYESSPMIIRRAKAFRNVLEHMTIFIEDGQLIAGSQAGRACAAPLFPEFCVDWIFEEIDDLPRRPGDRFLVPPEHREEILNLSRWWVGKTVQDRCRATLPQAVQDTYRTGILSANGNMTSGDGHIMLDFEKILHCGARGLILEAQTHLERLDGSDPASFHKRVFYEAIVIAYEAMIVFAQRYAQLAEALAEKEPNRRRQDELRELAAVCRHVPEFPARTFREGVQSVWFAHLLSQIESNGHSMSFGRLDQYLYPLYQADLAAGRITPEGVVELVSCLWIKSFGILKIRPWSHTRFSGGGPTYQNLTLGGVTPEGEDAVNPLTMLCLDSVALTKLPQPNVSARYHVKNPDAYLLKCVEVIQLGFGMPAMHSDQLMIPSLMSHGISQRDANNYAIVGCIEPIIPGKHGYRAAGMSFTNFPKILEVALNGGLDPKTGLRLLPDAVSLRDSASFSQLWNAFARQMEFYVKMRFTGEHVIDYAIEELVPEAFCAGLVQDCMARGKTPKEGGAVYDLTTGPETGLTNAANSLEAIRKLVFEERRLTGGQLADVLAANFQCADGERIRQMLLHKAPKFGNDVDEVDQLAKEIYELFIQALQKYHNTRYGRGPIGCYSYPCTATISGNVPSGVPVGASADGRFDGEPLAEGCSAVHGTDVKGPTAVLKSVSKVPNRKITGGNLLNIKLTPSVLKDASGQEKVAALIKSFFAMDGWHIQFNVISTETMRDAQKHPEQYTDLVVRVAGYSALFNSLEPRTQEDIILRTEHALA